MPSGKNAATATGETVSFDAGKWGKGRKRLVLTDTLGNLLASRVLPASEHDGTAAITFCDEGAAAHTLWGQGQVVFVDSTFHRAFRQHRAQRYAMQVQKPAHVAIEKKNFCLHAWRCQYTGTGVKRGSSYTAVLSVILSWPTRLPCSSSTRSAAVALGRRHSMVTSSTCLLTGGN